MSNLLLAIVCLSLGKILQRVKQFPEASAQVLNAYVIYIALPALILVQVPRITLNSQILAPVLLAWLIMGASAGITWTVSRFFRWRPATTGALLLVIMLGNTSFIGFPLIEAHLGSEALPYAILYDQLGTFLALNTAGIAIATHYSQEPHAQVEPFWRKILKFPPFAALVCGFALGGFSVPGYLAYVLERMADTLVPVVMVAVGLQWRLRVERTEYKLILFALFFILMIKPLMALGFVSVLDLDAIIAKTIVLEAAMPAMISTSVLAVSYNLAPRLVATTIGYSLMLSFLTVWGWSLIV